MKKFALLFLISATSTAASAQDLDLPSLEAPCAPETTENRSTVLSVNGSSGVWFHQAVARCILTRLQTLPLLITRVRLLEERLVISSERHTLRGRQVALAVDEASQARDALEAAIREARAEREASQRWYRHPAFWLSVGVVITIGLEAVAIWAFSQLKE